MEVNAAVRNGFFLSFLFVFWCTLVTGQKVVHFKTGSFPLITPAISDRQADQHQYLFFAADHVLSNDEKNSLEKEGVEILYALKENVYWVRVANVQQTAISKNLFDIDKNYKRGVSIDERSTFQKLRLTIAPGLSIEQIRDWASGQDIKLLDTRALSYGLVDVEIRSDLFDVILSTQWVAFVESIPQDEEVNYRLLNAERGWGLKSPLTRGLDGAGMTVGIGDGGRLGIHEDLAASVHDLASFGMSNHAMQVTGIVTGGGLLDPAFGFGYAPKAKVLIRNFSDILWDAPQYIEDFNLSLTNNSYSANPFDCAYIGDYTGTSTGLDAMIGDHPQLLHVFAAGNSGSITCAPFPFRYATVAGGYQSAKNVLTVGALGVADDIAYFSSRGPVDDGRLKPEVVAYGFGRFSTIVNNDYTSNSGTSFSSPATMGMATLLYERYKELHNDSLPDAALIKNVICNGADDLGTAGPDFNYGFGRINGVRSVEILETGHYDSVVVNHNSIIQKSIILPTGVASCDVMLMWSDIPSAPYETVSLVNDLDLLLVDPSGDTLRPWKLNYTPAGVTAAATTGVDHTNNYEQVTVSSVEQGTYTVIIKGYNVPMGPQVAWLSWDIHQNGIRLQSPIGGEVFKPGVPPSTAEQQYIRWDAFGTGNSTFSAEYSTNGGSSWNLISTSIPSTQRQLAWYIPNIPTDQFKVKISATNGMTDTSDDNAIIMAPPTNLTITSPCDGYAQVSWNTVSGADHYKIFLLKNEELIEIDTTSSLSYTVSGLNDDASQRISVAGVFPSGKAGLRARAVAIIANGGNSCTWNNDLRLDSLTNPLSGRQYTSTELSSSEIVRIYLVNAGLLNASGFSLSYQVNNGAVITEAFPGIINAGTGQYFSFTQTADLSSTGSYEMKIWSTYDSDPFKKNDTLDVTILHLPNPPIALPWNKDFESASDTEIISSEMGFSGLDECDAVLQNAARIRTFAGSPFCHSGERALTMDAVRNVSSVSGEVILTLNLDAFTVANDDDIRMSLYYMHHEIIPDVNNTEGIWVRGSDSDTFVPVTFLENDPSTRGIWQHLAGLEISDILIQAGQEFSSSFQVKFPFAVNATAGDPLSQDGQSIDDISFQKINRDITIDEVLHPTAISCGLGMESIEVSVTNTSIKTVTSANVSYRINGGTVYSTPIGTIPVDTTLHVVLTPAADFSNPGLYDLTVWVSSPGDALPQNDTIHMTVLNSPLITEYPYREGFEGNAGGWNAGGVNSTWIHGIPGKELIYRAAEGQHVWTTALTGTHNADELSYLYSPCFDLHGMDQPYLSFAFIYQLETNYDFAWVEYRLEGSDNWIKLGTQGSGTNWYNSPSNLWHGTQSGWVTTGNLIPFTDTIIQFRWVMSSDVGVEFEGIGIDQVNVYDLVPVYTGSPVQITSAVSGNDWVHFDQGGQRIFSIHPDGQDLGDVTMTLFKSGQNFLNGDSLYLLSRNWVLTSTNPPVDTIRMRGYFTSTEANNLVSATGCAECISLRDGFDVAALRYSGINEDGLFNNNNPSGVTTFSNDNTEVYPYASGYYTEWPADSMSEWWISSPVSKKAGMISRSVSASNDDAEEHQDNGAVNTIREVLTLTDYNGHQKIGWKFRNITVPAGSYISSAVLKWTAYDTSSGEANWVIQSQITPDASAFTTKKYDISLRQRSDQTVTHSPVAWSGNVEYTSPEIKHLIQRVIDQPSWVNGNDLVLIMSGTGIRDAWSYDGDPAKSAELIIQYDSACTDAGVSYVDKNAVGNQDGNSWANAYRSLEQALYRIAYCNSITQIWMADGVYAPYHEMPRTYSYAIPPGVHIYGGFQGHESDPAQRVYGAYPTVLSGDIGLQSQLADNLYHVVSVLPGVEFAVLDGITITGGMSDGPLPEQQIGSGIYNEGRLQCNGVILEGNSAPAVYNNVGSEMLNVGEVMVRD